MEFSKRQDSLLMISLQSYALKSVQNHVTYHYFKISLLSSQLIPPSLKEMEISPVKVSEIICISWRVSLILLFQSEPST